MAWHHFMSASCGKRSAHSTKPEPFLQGLRRGLGFFALVAPAAATLAAEPTGSSAATSPGPDANRSSRWNVGLSSAVKETYDSNVYLQSQTELANRPSFVTTWIGQATAAWSSTPWNVRLGYQPEAHFFHAQPTEDHFDHRANADLRFASGSTAVDLGGTAVLIDGASEGPTWTGPGGAPATGGPAVRDRRDAAVYRGCLRVTESLGDWLLRPTATGYEHDFRTETKTT
ncbi:MAG: hypothetical protein JNL97_06730, partial [Verrucomicrobiales bacterium]|nr:hypothetical protein [Verrucomicrobiales bacterium]